MRGKVVYKLDKRAGDRADQRAGYRGLGLSVLFVLALLILPGLVLADHATFANGIVILPVVEDYPRNSRLELRRIPGTSPLEFELLASGPSSAPLTASSPYFDGAFLVIPEIWIGTVSYWADLREIRLNRFRLDSYGRNPHPRCQWRAEGTQRH